MYIYNIYFKQLAHSCFDIHTMVIQYNTYYIPKCWAVSLSSLFSKILDNCILIMQSDSLQSDPLQFAYKENASTVQCASVICEVINYYINNDSCIYMCMLDASKAFDRVNHLSLFNKLKLRNMCPTIFEIFNVHLSETVCNGKLEW